MYVPSIRIPILSNIQYYITMRNSDLKITGTKNFNIQYNYVRNNAIKYMHFTIKILRVTIMLKVEFQVCCTYTVYLNYK